MTAAKKADEELRMNADEFDRIMRQALQVKPKDEKPKKQPKATKKKPER